MVSELKNIGWPLERFKTTDRAMPQMRRGSNGKLQTQQFKEK